MVETLRDYKIWHTWLQPTVIIVHPRDYNLPKPYQKGHENEWVYVDVVSARTWGVSISFQGYGGETRENEMPSVNINESQEIVDTNKSK